MIGGAVVSFVADFCCGGVTPTCRFADVSDWAIAVPTLQGRTKARVSRLVAGTRRDDVTVKVRSRLACFLRVEINDEAHFNTALTETVTSVCFTKLDWGRRLVQLEALFR